MKFVLKIIKDILELFTPTKYFQIHSQDYVSATLGLGFINGGEI